MKDGCGIARKLFEVMRESNADDRAKHTVCLPLKFGFDQNSPACSTRMEIRTAET